MWKAPRQQDARRSEEPAEQHEVHAASASMVAEDTRKPPPAGPRSALGDSAAAVFDGTGARVVRRRNDDSVISLFSNEDVDDDGYEAYEPDSPDDDQASRASSSDDSSEVTALADRRTPAEQTSQSTPETAGEPRPASPSVEDMSTTPGLHTAAFTGPRFGLSQEPPNSWANASRRTSPRPTSSSRQPSTPHSPVPLTLASYLSSSLSSPKTRSQSFSSLASFPTDLLSDISRPNSVVDTDEALSEFNSDEGSSVPHLPSVGKKKSASSSGSGSEDVDTAGASQGHNSELVMPRHAPASTSTTASGRHESSPSGSEMTGSDALRTARKATKAVSLSMGEAEPATRRLVIIGGSEVQQAELRDCVLGQGSYRQHRKPISYFGKVSVKKAADVTSAVDMVERPLDALQSILRPDPEHIVLDKLLPSLLDLDQVAAFSAALLILDPHTRHTSLSQLVSEQFQQIYRLSRVVPIIPILVRERICEERDSASELTQGNIEWLGLAKGGSIKPLRNKARPVWFDDIDAGFHDALLSCDFRTHMVKASQRWLSSHFLFTGRPSHKGSSACSSNGGERANMSASSSADSESVQVPSQVACSLASSMLHSDNTPALDAAGPDLQVTELDFETPSKRRIATTHARQPCIYYSADPLNLRSLIHIVGLNIAQSFTTFRWSIARLLGWRQDSRANADARPKQAPVDLSTSSEEVSIAQTRNVAGQVQPFLGCCAWRYRGQDEARPHLQQSKPVGIVFAGIIIGIALWYS